MNPKKNIDTVIEQASKAGAVAVVTGAGISSESGIPTFRGDGGLWKNYRAQDLATPDAFFKNPSLVWEWYDWRREICGKAEPNPAHFAVAEMEKSYTQFLLITQNVDGLHERAGSSKMIEIHGNIWQARCTQCHTVFGIPDYPLAEIPVKCTSCNELARPHIVWFGESYDRELLEDAMSFLSRCELLIVIGTSGMVSIPVYFAQQARSVGAFVVEINPNDSEISALANVSIRGKAGEALPEIWNRIKR